MEYINLDIDALSYRLELKIIFDCFKKTVLTLEKNNYPEINKLVVKQLKYRMIVSNIVMIVSTWEQQLTDFIYKYNKTTTNAYEKIKESYIKDLKIDKKIFDELSEYRNLVGVFKHGKNGDSFKKLQKKGSKYLNNSLFFDDLKDAPAFNLPILNIDETDVDMISEKFANFWSDIYLIFRI